MKTIKSFTSKVIYRYSSGNELPSVGSESSMAPHPPSLPPPGAQGSGHGLLSFRNYKPSLNGSLGSRNQDDHVFEVGTFSLSLVRLSVCTL